MNSKFPWRHTARDGGLLTLLFATFVTGSLAYDPEIWVHDYPPDIRERWGPKSERAQRRTRPVALLFMILFSGGIIGSNLRLRRANGGRLSLRHAFANAYGIFMLINLFDMAVLDWLLFYRLRPSFVILPGTEGMAGYEDFGFHVRASAKGSVMGLVMALVIALLTTRK